VRYWPPGAEHPIESANEVRLPVGQRVEFTLDAEEVIHSFWIPSLAGKMDMIPGRTNRLVVEATETGTFRGQCAEFCGTSHALMAFAAVTMEEDAFQQWLRAEAQPAAGDAADPGLQTFLAYGCGGCHTIRGTQADGRLGPDLTHVGGRKTLGAGILPNTVDGFREWIAHTQDVKPAARMPSFGMADEDDLLAMARYLESLQ
jgi:cytochrome c oxidase subunit 2